MVYCGKPSNACAQCRTKRTKCDTLRPSCNQCIRAGRICTGYRDPFLLSFRDETPKFTGSTSHGPSTNSGSSTIEAPQTNSETKDCIVSASLFEPIESQATCFFLRNYVWDSSEYSTGYSDYLPSLLANTKSTRGALVDVVVSLGMVGLSNANRSSDIMVAARQKYSSALRATNRALSNSDEAKSDETLVAVMLLGLYETNTCTTPRSMSSWTQHVYGALRVLQLRGKEQLQTKIGHEIFIQLRAAVVLSCLQMRTRAPELIMDWTKAAMVYESAEEIPGSILSSQIVRLCDLRASMNSIRDYRHSAKIVLSAFEIDAELATWASNMFTYETVTLQKRSEFVFSDNFHMYRNIRTATIWNHYRSVRVLLNELLIEQLAYLRQSSEVLPDIGGQHPSIFYEKQSVICRSLLLQLAQDICASVPFYLDQGGQGDCPPKAAGGNLLLWPLYTAGSTDVVSNDMRIWVINTLKRITETMGIEHAKALAYLLSIRKDPPEKLEARDTDEW